MKRKIPGDKCGCCCCTLKEKLNTLWNRAIGCINKINEITPDGVGKFTIEAGDNILLTEISNGMRISTTGGISYYSAGDSYIDVDNDLLQISLVNPGQSGGVALHDDLDTVAQAVSNIIDGTTQIGDAVHADSADSATYLGSDSSNVGSDTKPIKIVNGEAVAVTNELQTKFETTSGSGTYYTWIKYGKIVFLTVYYSNTTTGSFVVTSDVPINKGVNISTSTHDGNANPAGRVYINTNSTTLVVVCNVSNAQNIASITYLSE